LDILRTWDKSLSRRGLFVACTAGKGSIDVAPYGDVNTAIIYNQI
jgi:hypothetical protein